MLATANIQAAWTPAPSAEDIRLKDQERLVEQLRPTEEASEDDLTVARFLLAEGDPEQVVASLVRARRAALPAAEDLVDNEPVYTPREGQVRREGPGPRENLSEMVRPGFEDTVWFSINLGRNRNAEARWILPMICRKGHLTKQDIGAIRVFDRETRFQILRAAHDRFVAAVAKAEPDGVEIVELADPDLPPSRDRKPMGKKPYPPRGAPAGGAGGGYGDRDARPPRPRDNAASPPKPYKAKPYEKARSYEPALDTSPSAKPPTDKPRPGKPYKGKPKRDG